MKEINFKPNKDYVVCQWYTAEEKKDTKVILVGSAKGQREDSLNGVNEILAVGPDVPEGIKPGQWAMLAHMEVPIVNIDGIHCAMYKAHMIMGTFEEKPDIADNSKEGPSIRTKKTEEKALAFKDKYKQ